MVLDRERKFGEGFRRAVLVRVHEQRELILLVSVTTFFGRICQAAGKDLDVRAHTQLRFFHVDKRLCS